MPDALHTTPLRWGLLLPAPRSACLHCGRDATHHAGSCWSDPIGRFRDGVHAR